MLKIPLKKNNLSKTKKLRGNGKPTIKRQFLERVTRCMQKATMSGPKTIKTYRHGASYFALLIAAPSGCCLCLFKESIVFTPHLLFIRIFMTEFEPYFFSGAFG